MPISTDVVTRIGVTSGRVRLTPGLIRAQQLRAPAGMVRLGLVATTALLLAGDAVCLEVEVGPGVRLELRDIAGTVAYDAAGRSAGWHVHIVVAAGGELTWAGEPFVVADGADVDRTLLVEAAGTARVRMRETVVLGRHKEVGGRLRNRTDLRVDGRPVLSEDQLLDPAEVRNLPGVLRGARVLDTVTVLGEADAPAPLGTASFRLPFGAGQVVRFLGTELADSPLEHRGVGAEFVGRREGQAPRSVEGMRGDPIRSSWRP